MPAAGDGRSRHPAVGDGFVPAVVEGVEEAVFDFGGDVGVGLLDAVAQDVTQPSGLGDFGDVIAIIQVLWLWRSPWNVSPGLAGCSRTGAARYPAFGGRAQRAAPEVAAPVRFPAMGGEHVRMVVAGPVGLQEADQERGQGDRAGGLRGLRGSELDPTTGLDHGADERIDDDDAIVEVGVAGQPRG
jgi:hypothetical protein